MVLGPFRCVLRVNAPLAVTWFGRTLPIWMFRGLSLLVRLPINTVNLGCSLPDSAKFGTGDWVEEERMNVTS